jgi:hypothetical protein
MLGPGHRVPEARVWLAPGEPSASLRELLAAEQRALLCFYPFDWSGG